MKCALVPRRHTHQLCSRGTESCRRVAGVEAAARWLEPGERNSAMTAKNPAQFPRRRSADSSALQPTASALFGHGPLAAAPTSAGTRSFGRINFCAFPASFAALGAALSPAPSSPDRKPQNPTGRALDEALSGSAVLGFCAVERDGLWWSEPGPLRNRPRRRRPARRSESALAEVFGAARIRSPLAFAPRTAPGRPAAVCARRRRSPAATGTSSLATDGLGFLLLREYRITGIRVYQRGLRRHTRASRFISPDCSKPCSAPGWKRGLAWPWLQCERHAGPVPHGPCARCGQPQRVSGARASGSAAGSGPRHSRRICGSR